MFQHQGVWLPDGEKHFPEWMNKNGELVDGKGTYQIKKYRAAMDLMSYPNLRVAIDIGAHVGMWAMQMVKNFDHVHCFEPVASFRECLMLNLPPQQGRGDYADWWLHPLALGSVPGHVAMHINDADTGGTHVATENGEPVTGGDIEVRTLDSFHFDMVDFIKIDCEGYEHHVVDGARETLMRCKPCVIVEQKQHIMGRNFGIQGTPAVDMLKSMGYRVRREIGGDYILSAE